MLSLRLLPLVHVAAIFLAACSIASGETPQRLNWEELPPLPNPIGVAGPFVGVHQNALIVAGGANFPAPTWESEKQWLDTIYVLAADPQQQKLTWRTAGRMPSPIAYGAAVSTSAGVICIGGDNGEQTLKNVWRLRWDGQQIAIDDLPALPEPCAYGQATVIGDVVYVAGGQRDHDLKSALSNFWALDLSTADSADFGWKELEPFPGPARAFNIVAAQHNGFNDCVYVIGGRCEVAGKVTFLSDVWEFSPQRNKWRQRTSSIRPIAAGAGIGFGQSHIFVLSGADGSLWDSAAELADKHPGFPREAFSYHTITDTWISLGETPANQVTTIPVLWNGDIILASGELRPRVRTPHVWSVRPAPALPTFGWVNYAVLVVYLLSMVGVGVWFAHRSKSTDDYFRGGMHIPWWAAGCSIFATMLSSLTFTGIPSKAYAQDWVYAMGNFMIPVVAVIAVFVAMPFFRRIDATSAYEYLEKRFNQYVRVFGSLSFVVFHLFRMSVVMSLTGLALAVATPLTPSQSVLLMGVLSILYCTMGGVEAVIWTDTIQTVVLLGGALIALFLLISDVDNGLAGFFTTSQLHHKFAIANFHADPSDARIALWVIIVGGFAQNISSYTADQAVVQRYMTTASPKLAARSIWMSAFLAIPATILFFGIGSALFAFYQSHPERLAPTITTDQIFPWFIATEMPIGLSGLIVAGIFAAAQSTVSTSMNSTSTSIVTDLLRPVRFCSTEHGYLRAARLLTLGIGIAGTLLGLAFVDPSIRSLFEAFIKVIGLFMGVLGGLFVLGALTRRATGFGAMTGAMAGAGVMCWVWLDGRINGYLYTAIGITVCVVVGYITSLLTGSETKDLTGLTIHTLEQPPSIAEEPIRTPPPEPSV